MQETASWVSLLFNSAIKRTMYRTTLSFFAVNYKVFRFTLFLYVVNYEAFGLCLSSKIGIVIVTS